jgi:aspartate carbamoyltransferase regulatory subunit
MLSKKELNVSALKDGTVIDHIPANSLFKVISILGLEKVNTMITFGTNLDSKRLGHKGIIKISNLFFADADINKIALVAPDAKLNTIKEYRVVEKKVVEVPDEIVGIVRCMNPSCVTNHQRITTRFYVVDKKTVDLRCHYCEKITDQENIKIIAEE